MWRGHISGRGGRADGVQDLHDQLRSGNFPFRLMHSHHDTNVRELPAGHVPGCDGRADGMQDLCGQHLPKRHWADCLSRVHAELYRGPAAQRCLHTVDDRNVWDLRDRHVPGCPRSFYVQDVHVELRAGSVSRRQLHAHHNRLVCGVRDRHVPGCGWWANGMQGVRGEHVPECWQPDGLHWLHTGLCDWTVSERDLHVDDFRLLCGLRWRQLPGCGGQQLGLQDLYDQLPSGAVPCGLLHCHHVGSVCELWPRHVSGRGGRADGVQGVWCEHVPEQQRSNCVRGLHTELHDGPVSDGQLQRHDNGLVRCMHGRHFPGRGGKQHGLQELHDEL